MIPYARESTAALVLVALTAFGCDSAVAGHTFDDLFPEVERAVLEERVNDPVTEITSLTPLSAGGFIVVVGPAGRVREYTATGALRRSWDRLLALDPAGGSRFHRTDT